MINLPRKHARNTIGLVTETERAGQKLLESARNLILRHNVTSWSSVRTNAHAYVTAPIFTTHRSDSDDGLRLHFFHSGRVQKIDATADNMEGGHCRCDPHLRYRYVLGLADGSALFFIIRNFSGTPFTACSLANFASRISRNSLVQRSNLPGDCFGG